MAGGASVPEAESARRGGALGTLAGLLAPPVAAAAAWWMLFVLPAGGGSDPASRAAPIFALFVFQVLALSLAAAAPAPGPWRAAAGEVVAAAGFPLIVLPLAAGSAGLAGGGVREAALLSGAFSAALLLGSLPLLVFGGRAARALGVAILGFALIGGVFALRRLLVDPYTTLPGELRRALLDAALDANPLCAISGGVLGFDWFRHDYQFGSGRLLVGEVNFRYPRVPATAMIHVGIAAAGLVLAAVCHAAVGGLRAVLRRGAEPDAR